MKSSLSKTEMAAGHLADFCGELDRLTRRVENIRSGILGAAATAIAATGQRDLAPAAGRWALPPVLPMTTHPELIAKVKAALRLDTKKEAQIMAGRVVDALEETLIDNVGQNGFSIKLGSFGKFSIRHRPGTYRKIPLTGETRMTSTKRKVKFVAIGRLRQLERVDGAR